MGKTRFSTRLVVRALVVAVAAGGGLLIGGVANAAPPATSSAVSLAVNDDKETTTTLIVAPSGSFPEDLPVTFVAIVRPRAAEGTVQFKDGDANIGDPVPVRNGAAFTITPTLTVGTHSLTAVFAPTNPASFDPSTSTSVSLTVTPSIIAGLPFSIDSLLQSIFEGRSGGAAGFDPEPLIKSILEPILDGLPDVTVDPDPGLITTLELLRF